MRSRERETRCGRVLKQAIGELVKSVRNVYGTVRCIVMVKLKPMLSRSVNCVLDAVLDYVSVTSLNVSFRFIRQSSLGRA